jgi:hypothetical protein
VRWLRETLFTQLLDLVKIDNGVDNKYWDLALELDLENKLKDLGYNVALQGEMCGPSIQANSYKLTNKHIFIFNVYDLDNQVYWPTDKSRDLCKKLDLQFVPVIYDKFVLTHSIDQLLTMSDGMSLVNPKTRREGLVFRLVNPTYDTSIAGLNRGFVSYKVISNKWLEKQL